MTDIHPQGRMVRAYGHGFFMSTKCMDPECKELHDSGELFINASCHTGAGVDAMYKGGAIYFYCHRCLLPIITVALNHDTVKVEEILISEDSFKR